MDTIYINDKDKEIDFLNLTLEKDTNIIIFKHCFKNITINVLDNINIQINEFNKEQTDETNINFIINNNSKLVYNLSNIVENKYNLNINITYNGVNSHVATNIHSIVSNKEIININGKVQNFAKNNELIENVQVLLKEKALCEVNPYMLISTKEVSANHLVGISPIRTEELLYLMGKGLSKTSSESLIYKSFISSILNDELKTKIKEEL